MDQPQKEQGRYSAEVPKSPSVPEIVPEIAEVPKSPSVPEIAEVPKSPSVPEIASTMGAKDGINLGNRLRLGGVLIQ
jgi:hypothetical protein